MSWSQSNPPPQGPSSLSDASFSSVQSEKVKVIKKMVTQLTSITTGVTVNASSGVVTTVSSTLAAHATAQFTVTNSHVSSSSVVMLTIQDFSGTIGDRCVSANVDSVAEGSFIVSLVNGGTTALDGVVKIGFLVV